MKKTKVQKFCLQETKSFPDGAPQRECYNSDEGYFKACGRYDAEWRAQYECAGCGDSVCPQCGLAKAPTITQKQIKAALKKGAAGAAELDKKLDQVFRPPTAAEDYYLR